MKTEVKFVVSDPIAFTSEEDYSHLGIEIFIIDGKLVALQTVVEHDAAGGHDEIIAKARSRITPLLTLIEFGHGLPANIGAVLTHTLEPVSEVSIGLGFVRAEATLVRPVPMPPAELVAGLTEVTRLQIEWYLVGRNSPFAIERIKNYYKVLELEEQLTPKLVPPYHPPPEAMNLRNAVSHPQPDNRKVVSYLQKNLRSSKIDPKNKEHLSFLEQKATYLHSLAQCVLDAKVPKWW
jgi:hypothetical protein